jgi:hypothetical protein
MSVPGLGSADDSRWGTTNGTVLNGSIKTELYSEITMIGMQIASVSAMLRVFGEWRTGDQDKKSARPG